MSTPQGATTDIGNTILCETASGTLTLATKRCCNNKQHHEVQQLALLAPRGEITGTVYM